MSAPSSIPLTLPNGYILVYGWGSTESMSGVANNTPGFLFGSVYQIWDGGTTYVYGGDEVMWNDKNEFCKLTYSGVPYTMLPARLVTKQEIIH